MHELSERVETGSGRDGEDECIDTKTNPSKHGRGTPRNRTLSAASTPGRHRCPSSLPTRSWKGPTHERGVRTEEDSQTHLSCTLKSSSISSSSQLSSHSLSPPDFAAPGAVPPKCARSVWESSQSRARRRNDQHTRSSIHSCAGARASLQPLHEQGRTCYSELLELVVFLQHAQVRDIIIFRVLDCRRGALNRLRCGR